MYTVTILVLCCYLSSLSQGGPSMILPGAENQSSVAGQNMKRPQKKFLHFFNQVFIWLKLCYLTYFWDLLSKVNVVMHIYVDRVVRKF